MHQKLRDQFKLVVNEIRAGTTVVVQWGGFDAAEGSAKKRAANAKYIAACNPAAIQQCAEEFAAMRDRAEAAERREKGLREALADVKWRIDDITAMVIQRTDDEFSVPVLNLKSASNIISAALAQSQEVVA